MAQQAAEQCARIAADAQAQAESILAEARAQAAAHRDAVWRTVKSEEAHKDRITAQFARVKAEKARLLARNSAVTDVMEVVDAEIARLVKGSGFGPILEKLLEEALDASTGPVVVEAPARHVDAVRAVVQRHGGDVRDVVASPTLRDGVSVWNPERTLRIMNTLRARLAILEDDVRKYIVQRLFT
jgi:vacuolar-type H+-ATPase subunit E/Vma4